MIPLRCPIAGFERQPRNRKISNFKKNKKDPHTTPCSGGVIHVLWYSLVRMTPVCRVAR